MNKGVRIECHFTPLQTEKYTYLLHKPADSVCLSSKILQFPVKVRSYRLRETPADTLRTWQIGALEV